jgi:hypothetical protein
MTINKLKFGTLAALVLLLSLAVAGQETTGGIEGMLKIPPEPLCPILR